jgi:uncharacterized protein (TIGR02145 family)
MSLIKSNFKIYNAVIIGVLFLVSITSCEKTVPITIPDYTGQRGVIYDIEGNKYKTIGIGSQIWMAENLRSTKFNDNFELKNLNDSMDWTAISEPGYSWYANDTLLKIPYGGLYNWCAVNSQKLCPSGWHIPSVGEWRALTNRLGGENVAGGKLKVIGSSYWNCNNFYATNSSKFNAVPSGGVFYGEFLSLGIWSHWWSSTQTDSITVTTMDLSCKSPAALIGPGGQIYSYGLSVRCIKDH